MPFRLILANVALAACLLMPTVSRAGWCPLDRNACGIRGLPGSVVEGIIRVESGGNVRGRLHVGIGKGFSLLSEGAGTRPGGSWRWPWR